MNKPRSQTRRPREGSAALELSQAALTSLLESMTDLVWAVDSEHRLVAFNSAFATHLRQDCGSDARLGARPSDLLPSERVPAWSALYERALAEGAFLHEDALADGRTLELAFNPMRRNGAHVGVSVVGKDATERMRSQKAMSGSEESAHTLAESVPHMVWTSTPDGMNVYFNKLSVDYTGLTQEENTGRGWTTRFHPDDRQPARDAWNEAIATGVAYRVEGRLRAADGSYRWFLVRGVPLRDSAGSILRWFGTCTEIDSLKQAEAGLADAQRALSLWQALARVFLTVPGEEAYSQLLEIIVDATGGGTGRIGYLDEDGALVWPSTERAPELRVARASWTGLLAASLSQKRSLYSNQPETIAGAPGPVERILLVPILRHDELLGLLEVANRESAYTERDKAKLERIAAHMAPVLWARLHREREEVARQHAEEQQRLVNAELEEKLRQRAAEFEAASKWLEVAERVASAGFWSWDIAAQRATYSDALLELFGLSVKTAPSFEALAHAARGWDFEPPGAAIDRAANFSKPVTVEFRIIVHGGAVRWIRSVSNVIVDEAGSPHCVAGVCVDVTEHRQARDAVAALNQSLQQRVAQLQTILDTVPIGIGISEDSEARQIQGNPELARMLGAAAGAELSKAAPDAHYQILMNGHEVAVSDLPMQRAARGEVVTGYICDIVRADGQTITIQASAAPILDAQRGTLGAVGAFVDITQQQRIERELRQRSDELQTALTELETFSYAVAHDLRGPLRHIDGFAMLLADDIGPALNAATQRDLDVIRVSANLMAQLLEDMLSVLQLGRQELSIRACDLNVLIGEVVHELAPELRQREVEWRIAQLPVVQCDRGLMKLVFSHLLSNALKFSRDRPQAVIEIDHSTLPGGPVVFVRDNGVGFDMKYSDKLFGLFQRLHGQHEFEGTGIGLTVVQRVMRRHGGCAWAEAEPGRGATFYLSLHSPMPIDARDESTS